MSSTFSEAFTDENARIHTGPLETIRPAAPERTHFARMAGLYAWILVTLAIFLIAATLSGIQKNQAAAGPEGSEVETVRVSDLR
ncbi:MAG TPA: hypothetical protein VGO88_08820 [Mycetocola sp.]|jgi:hypothetical protein|uniref:hypothetical protein n=1 Tax=Mycetocola sp. TaxID=1871042 RepID=UPI0026133B8C|nr:hypothetical protein [Mycetocola sp.]MCU1560208.1 hypothetical protein [Mycetocola sp.]HEV7849408.1 hypothetical protein [Mycetocola sp.]